MTNIIINLDKQIKELNIQDEILFNKGLSFNSLDRQNIRACMLDIKNIIKTLETIK